MRSPEHEAALRDAVRRLKGGVSPELGGLNEDEPELALRYAVEVLERELLIAKATLAAIEGPDQRSLPEAA